VSTVTRRQAVQEYLASEPRTIEDLQLAVLIDHAAASSAEIVAGSLQDHQRAVVVGERSFGKGSVQHMIRLTGHPAAVKLTVAYYRLPGGRVIHRTTRNVQSEQWGVRPDIAVADTRGDGSRSNGQAGAGAGATSPLAEDAQLRAAVELLRGELAAATSPNTPD